MFDPKFCLLKLLKLTFPIKIKFEIGRRPFTHPLCLGDSPLPGLRDGYRPTIARKKNKKINEFDLMDFMVKIIFHLIVESDI